MALRNNKSDVGGDKVKILQILHYPGQGGAEQYAYLLAKSAREEGHEVVFIFGQDGPFVKRVEKLGCEVRYLPMRSPFDPIAIGQLSRIYKELKPDIVQTHFLRENFVAIAAAKLTPVGAIYSTVHRIEPKTELQAKFNRFYSKGLTKFIAVSDLVKDYLIEEGIKESKIVVIQNGVEVRRVSRERVRKELKLSETDQIISCVARFTPEKGQANLIKAFSKVENPKAKLLLVGNGELMEKMQKTVKDNRIIFCGYRERGYEVIAASDLYVQPSEVESFGMSAVEAMLLKVPVVLSDIPSFRYLAGKNERGELANPKKALEFAEKIKETLQKPDQKKIKAAYNFASRRFTSEVMWTKTKGLYEHGLALQTLKK